MHQQGIVHSCPFGKGFNSISVNGFGGGSIIFSVINSGIGSGIDNHLRGIGIKHAFNAGGICQVAPVTPKGNVVNICKGFLQGAAHLAIFTEDKNLCVFHAVTIPKAKGAFKHKNLWGLKFLAGAGAKW